MRKKNPSTLLDQQQIMKKYGLNKAVIRKYFPPAQVRTMRGRGGGRWTVGVWPESEVQRVLERPELQAWLGERRQQDEEQRRLREIAALLRDYSPESYIDRARTLRRSFVLHVGPTNSGKTYDAIEDLKKNTPGTYLSPLRLLALEMYDKLNAAGVPCSMLTGEESLPVENARVVSSTIELCDTRTRFRTAVIDEAQLIADPSRGASWLRAICLVDAEVVHICMAPEALSYIEGLIKRFSDAYSVVRHERLAPLRYGGECRDYRDLRPDDAVICFSRKSVLSTAALLEKNGFRASVIYGALPPEARRNEVRKYMSGENNIVVATDAIGLGISLPIRRVVFAETEKFDGRAFRPLNTAEIKQIGGRAGRYGLHEYGEVLVLGDSPIVKEKLGQTVGNVRAACIAFPREVLATEYPLKLLLKAWRSLEKNRDFMREDMHDAEILLGCLKVRETPENREMIFDLITCPIDARSEELVSYWTECARAILRKRPVPNPWFDTETLLGCELAYKAYDIRHQLLRRIGRNDDCTEQRRAICERIAELMRESKEDYIRRCRVCGKELPIGYIYNDCEHCFSLLKNRRL